MSCIATIAIGAVLLVVSSWYEMVKPIPQVTARSDGWDRLDPDLVRRVRNLSALHAEANRRLPSFDRASAALKMKTLFDVTALRFWGEGAPARHTLASNWILYFLGMTHVAFSSAFDPDKTLQLGTVASCDQNSYILLQLALKSGIPARHVGLYGHVVMEAWYDNDWHMYDSHLEVMAARENGTIMGVEDLSRDKEKIAKAYEGRGVDRIVEIFTTRENSNFVSYPVGAYFVWKADVLSWFQYFTEWLKYIIPILMIIIGLWVYKRDLISSRYKGRQQASISV